MPRLPPLRCSLLFLLLLQCLQSLPSEVSGLSLFKSQIASQITRLRGLGKYSSSSSSSSLELVSSSAELISPSSLSPSTIKKTAKIAQILAQIRKNARTMKTGKTLENVVKMKGNEPFAEVVRVQQVIDECQSEDQKNSLKMLAEGKRKARECVRGCNN